MLAVISPYTGVHRTTWHTTYGRNLDIVLSALQIIFYMMQAYIRDVILHDVGLHSRPLFTQPSEHFTHTHTIMFNHLYISVHSISHGTLQCWLNARLSSCIHYSVEVTAELHRIVSELISFRSWAYTTGLYAQLGVIMVVSDRGHIPQGCTQLGVNRVVSDRGHIPFALSIASRKRHF